jgi:hypothetical protein
MYLLKKSVVDGELWRYDELQYTTYFPKLSKMELRFLHTTRMEYKQCFLT